MPLERIERHSPVYDRPSRTQRIGHFLATGGLSILKTDRPRPTDEEIVKAESDGYDPTKVQPIIDWLEWQGTTGERAAAILRGALNDLVDQVNLQETQVSSPE